MADDKIVAIHGARPAAEPKADPETVAALEGLLERARSGEIVGFGFFAVGTKGVPVCSTGWVGTAASWSDMLAANAVLHGRMVASAVGRAEGED